MPVPLARAINATINATSSQFSSSTPRPYVGRRRIAPRQVTKRRVRPSRLPFLSLAALFAAHSYPHFHLLLYLSSALVYSPYEPDSLPLDLALALAVLFLTTI